MLITVHIKCIQPRKASVQHSQIATRMWNMIPSPATPTVCLEQKYHSEFTFPIEQPSHKATTCGIRRSWKLKVKPNLGCCINIAITISYTLSREYRVVRYRYSRLFFTSEDRLCANLRVQEQSTNMTSQCQCPTFAWRHRSTVVTSQY